jgi:uncharacterized protein (TIGR02466 family)
MIKELWATPVLETELANYKNISKALIRCAQNAPVDRRVDKTNLFDHFGDDSDLNLFKQQIKHYCEELLGQYHRKTFKFGRSWISTVYPFGFTDPHKHFGAMAAVVYYIQVPPRSGNLLLFDPRGGDRDWGNVVENGKSGRITHEIVAQEGKLVIFPGYLLHATGLNCSDQTRISFAANIRNDEY